MVFTNVHKAIRVANFIANISIVQSDGNLHYFCEADLHNLIEKNGFDQSWKSTINADEIFADEKNFLEEKFTGTLYCNGNTVHANKCILMAFGNNSNQIDAKPSQIFRLLIESQMDEDESDEIKISDVDSKVMLEILRFIYTGKVNYLHKRAKDLLDAANKFNVVGLKEAFVKVMEKQLSIENVVKILELAYELKRNDLKENCIDFIKL
ncbi:unnamed protein product [Chironomus riparius]|uniref:BTB domain-containing protein n=1 Tax=Chironomus riparius TaxID=315576 RepID=A0A9N9S8K4_9DIPT|nr:unnamed protein product [Chironomus riparius]